MSQWEYAIISRQGGMWSDNRGDPRTPQERLTAMGKEGWELVSVCYDTAGYNFYLKRMHETRKIKSTSTGGKVKQL